MQERHEEASQGKGSQPFTEDAAEAKFKDDEEVGVAIATYSSQPCFCSVYKNKTLPLYDLYIPSYS